MAKNVEFSWFLLLIFITWKRQTSGRKFIPYYCIILYVQKKQTIKCHCIPSFFYSLYKPYTNSKGLPLLKEDFIFTQIKIIIIIFRK